MKNKNSGFTLVELIVVVLMIGLVVLLFTQIPLFSLSSWRKGSERLKLQRDANYAMIRIQRKLRPASSSNVKVLYPYWLDIDQTTGESFFLLGNQLVYRESDEVEPKPVIEDETGTHGFEVTDVTTTDGARTINITLSLARENGDIILETAVKPRN